MSKSLHDITLTPRRHTHGLWYVEIIRPGIVAEQVGDFASMAAAEDWIRQNAKSYFGLQLPMNDAMTDRKASGCRGGRARPG